MAVSFDRVAGIYDATRWSGIPPEVLQKILAAMRDALKSSHRILDVGVGTGRFAQYFVENGLAVVGIDLSLQMMRQAKSKGVEDLVRADANFLPFKDQSFDGSVMVHVLHLVRDWVQVVHEVGRVTKKVVISEAGNTDGFDPRESYLELREELGYPLKRFNAGESSLRKMIAPESVVSAGDCWTETDPKEQIDTFEARRSSVMWDVPEDVHKRIMQQLHREHDGERSRLHEILEVVSWDPTQFRNFQP